ncbi:MAG: Cof-type HAD-IIB family hydrolase [Candidatus Eremiobacteraeota bacterium]|nr:Cof-type HAD-IIB family hydrolase [Candidatus Eremiobacteraeota bacterium]
MEVSPIELIALDLDGTLLNTNEGVSSENRAAISEALAAGVRVVIVTGRGADTPAHIARELNLNLPMICAHGAHTKNFISGKVFGHIPVPLQYAKPMLEFAEANGLDTAVYLEESFWRLAGAPRYLDDMRGPYWRDVETFTDVLHQAPTFIRFFGRDSVAAIRTSFADLPVHFKYETWGDFEELAVTSMQATKKNALKHLCDDFRIQSKNVLAIGDSRNDVPMLRWAGIGVAMDNALPEVKAAVPNLTASNDEDGVARAIRRFVLDPLEEEKETA